MNLVVKSGTYRYHVKRSYFKIRRVATRDIVPLLGGMSLFYFRRIEMLDIKFVRENPEVVKENIRKKFQDEKIPLVGEVLKEDKELRQAQQHADDLRSKRKKISKEIGIMMSQGKKEEAEAIKAQISEIAEELDALEEREEKLRESVKNKMMQIPNIIDDSVPIGKDDSENVELEKYGEPVVPDFEIPYHTEIMERLSGIDLDSARKVAGNGFYYLMGDIARLHSAIISYARDFMINKGFTYVIPPYMIRSSVVNGVMSFAEMEGMMYKIEGEDLYLIGTSEHSMIGKFIDTILDEKIFLIHILLILHVSEKKKVHMV